jgi:hypothetical protein
MGVRLAAFIACCTLLAAAPGCGGPGAKEPKTVVLQVRTKPATASVTIDDRTYPATTVAIGAVRLTPGEHRISVEAPGYLPWDRLVTAGDAPVILSVELVPIPD